MRELIVPSLSKPLTLWNFLTKKFPLGYVRKVFDKKGVRVNGQRGNKNTVLKGKEMLTFYVPLVLSEKKIEQFPADIIYEDDAILVLHKKAGIAVHEGKTISSRQSLIGILKAWYKDKKVVPHLVHRLDKDTSGCLLIVKEERLVSQFEKMFEKGEIQKEYTALVKGIITKDAGVISLPLPGRDGYLVPAKTTYTVQQRFPNIPATLVNISLHTGRMHQIRLHFSQLGNPIVMDSEHGDFTFNKQFRKQYKLKRQFLHAKKLSFLYKGKTMTFTAPFSADIARIVQMLRMTG